MRKLIASTFVSLDGVMQAPGGPEEDPTESFALGGWSFGFWDEVMGQSMSGFDGIDRELVLGRKTYVITAKAPLAVSMTPYRLSKDQARELSGLLALAAK